MMRRLYFLFPSQAEARAAVSTLNSANIPQRFMHALAREGLRLKNLPQASVNQQHDLHTRLAHYFWNGDLFIFTLALIGFLLALMMGSMIWVIAALILMITTFSVGAFYAIRVPDVTLADFQYALSHDEILLMVDVPKNRLHEVEELVHHSHPAAISEGSSWTLDILGI